MLKRLQQLIIPEQKGLINAVNHNMVVGPGGVCQHPTNILFSDNFDGQADYFPTPGFSTPPTNWHSMRNVETWTSADGALPSIRIDGNDSSMVRGGVGKALICTAESYNDTSNNGFTSDGAIAYSFTDRSEVYAEFYIRFQPGWAGASGQDGGQSKIFRFYHRDSGGQYWSFFTDGDAGPIYLFDWAQNSFGARHFHAFRGDPQQDINDYFLPDSEISGNNRQIVSGDMSANFTDDNAAELNVDIPDQLNGGFLPKTGTIYHEQVWGDGLWNKVGFYVKLNTIAGTPDGSLKWWLNDQLIADYGVAWIQPGGDLSAGWNTVALGGNDLFHWEDENNPAYSASRERYYSIDDFKLYETIPSELL